MDISLDVLQILIAILIVTLGAILQGSIGFGLGPLCVPLLVLLDPIFIPGPLLLAALLLTILMFRRENTDIVFQEVKIAVLGRIIGSIMGALVLLVIVKSHLSLFFAIIILFSLLINFSGLTLKVNNKNLIITGIVSGFMGTTASIGGPPMGLLYQREKGPKIRGTLSSIFMIGTIIALISLIFIDKFGYNEIKISLFLIPGILAGFFISKYSLKIIDKGYIKKAILIVSASTSLILIIRFIFE